MSTGAGPPGARALTPGDLAAHWSLGPGVQLRALAGGSINGAYRVQTRTGPFHLRVYRDPRPERAGREHHAIEVARAAGVPTPAPVPTRQGGTLARLALGWAALFEWAPGEPVPRAALTPAHAAALGEFLARLHAQLPATVAFEVPPLAPPAPVARALERLEAVRAAILARPTPDEVDRWALVRTEQRLTHLRTGPRPDPAPADTGPALPSRFLHGDYHDGNVFFQAGQPAALIDWEQTRLAPRAWEIVRALHLSLGLQADLGRSFLAGYRTRQPLPHEELQAGADLYATLQERNVWTLESVYLHGNPGPRRFVRPPPYVPFGTAWAAAGLR
ncbi:phosphotransferase enzyme family protein [Deinococcus aquaedulcis]|uniref:phosphotransferase enzyme family protein n=1 Tax=Deinococcus aquaedulcis TaxID=2840455 RepID=UPI001C838812|nr:phosphotransferase [Deinococcus aquaedulcis]